MGVEDGRTQAPEPRPKPASEPRRAAACEADLVLFDVSAVGPDATDAAIDALAEHVAALAQSALLPGFRRSQRRRRGSR